VVCQSGAASRCDPQKGAKATQSTIQCNPTMRSSPHDARPCPASPRGRQAVLLGTGRLSLLSTQPRQAGPALQVSRRVRVDRSICSARGLYALLCSALLCSAPLLAHSRACACVCSATIHTRDSGSDRRAGAVGRCSAHCGLRYRQFSALPADLRRTRARTRGCAALRCRRRSAWSLRSRSTPTR
jgi:hypothetical protein